MSTLSEKCQGKKNDGSPCSYNSNNRFGSGRYCKRHYLKYEFQDSSNLHEENSRISIEFVLDEGQKCSICLEQISYGEKLAVAQTPCFHVYHLKCARQWIEKNNTCPICRFRLEMSDIFLIKQPNLELMKNLEDKFREFIEKNSNNINSLMIMQDILSVL